MKKITKDTIEIIFKIAKTRKISMVKLSELTRIPYPSLFRYKSFKNDITLNKYYTILEVLNVSEAELIK